jgi:hypothetical protein
MRLWCPTRFVGDQPGGASGPKVCAYQAFREADDGTRTRYLQLGKLSLYPVSYVREEGGRA